MEKMTLKDYYQSLKKDVPPKKAFITRIADLCGVDLFTVRMWVTGRNKPSKAEYYDILSKETGIAKEDLFV